MPMVSLMAQLHSLSQDDQNELQNDFFGYVVPFVAVLASCDGDGIISGNIIFLRSRQST